MNSKEKQTTTPRDDKEEAWKETNTTTQQKSQEERNISDSQEEKKGKKDIEDKEEGKKEKESSLSKEEKIEKELKDTKKEIEEYKDKYLRLAAEFDNYRRRTMKEKAELILNGSEKCINSILPVVDDLERALANMEKAENIESVNNGIKLIYNKFVQILNRNGVKEIETEGKKLDTDYHEAIAIVPVQDEKQKGKIIDCTQKGYTLNEKVIRHAKVVIGQ